MNNNKQTARKIVTKLESTLHEMKAQLKEHWRGGNEKKHIQTMIDKRDSEIHYRRFFEAAKDGILILDAESGAITDANPFISEILGYSPEDLIGKRLWEIGAFFDVVASKAAFEELQRKEYIRYENIPLHTKDGQLREVEFISNVYEDKFKKLIQCNIRNIAKRKEAEEALRESEVRYRRLFESAKDGILILDAETGKIIDANPFLLKILNYPQDEVIGKELWEIGPFKEIIANQDTFRKLQHQEYVHYEHLLLQNKSGLTIHVEFISTFYLMNERKVIQCNIRDITERKRIEEKMIELAAIVQSSEDAIIGKSLDGIIKSWNKGAEKIYGYTEREVIGKSISLLISHGNEDEMSGILHRIRSGEVIEHFEIARRRKDGREIQMSLAISPIRNPEGKIIAASTIGRDITERKRAEQELIIANKELAFQNEEKEKRAAELIIANKELAFQNEEKENRAAELIIANKELVFQNEEKEKRAAELIIANKELAFQNEEKEKRAAELIIANKELAFQNEEKEKRAAELIIANKELVFQNEERNRVEEALRKSEEKFRCLFESSWDAIMIMEPPSWTFTAGNPATVKMFGAKNEEEFVSRGPWELSPDCQPDGRASAEKSKEMIEAAMREGSRFFEWTHRRIGGKEFPADVLLTRMEQNGKVILQATVRDITERKRAEATLRESEERYKALFERSLDLVYICDFDGNFIDANDVALNLFGYKREEIGSLNFASMLSNDQLPLAFKITQEIKETGIQKKLAEFKFRCRNGQEVHVESKGSAIISNGITIAIQSIARNITERKQAEQEILVLARFPAENPNPVLRVEEDGKIIYANHASELLLHNWNCTVGEYLPPGWREKVVNVVRHSTRTTVDVECEDRIYSMMVVAIPDAGYVNVYGRDITERNQIEKVLRESEEQSRVIFEQSAVGMAQVALDGRWLHLNQRLCDIVGYTREELLTKSFQDITHPDDIGNDIANLQRLLAGEIQTYSREKRYIRKDGSSVYVNLTVSLVHEPTGTPKYFVSVIEDITERKKAEEQNRQLQQQLIQAQKLESLGTLASGIAHDFNNILGIILAYSSLLEKATKMTPKKLSESIGAINNAVQRGAALVRQILTFARKTDILIEPMSLLEIVHELFSMLSQTFPKTIIFKEIIEKDIPYISADRTQIYQALLNLCVNARDAMSNSGCITLSIEKRSGEQIRGQFPTANQDSYLCVSVTDTGEGMDETIRSRIFDPFFTTKEKGKGTGLGLSVVFGVVQTHHGFIDVESAPGKGTTFRLYLPVSKIVKPMRIEA